MSEPDVLVYLMTGFLDSGKTQFLNFTLKQEYFQIDGTTLLLLCEEGEEEYDAEELKKYDVVMESINSQEELTEEYLLALDIKYRPERVIVEYNGMWKVSDFEALRLPAGWGIEQKLTTVDASTFQMYLTNLKPLFVEMVRGAEMVLFNRCTDIKPLAGYRRSVKVVSPRAEVIFEDDEGEIENIFQGDVPYDMNAPIIQIRPEDYGIWYVDAMENQDKYRGKTVEYTARVLKPKSFPSKLFFPGRMAMTCCEDDTTFLGYVCKSAYAPKLKAGQWVTIRAKIRYEKLAMYHGSGPVLEAEYIEEAEAIPELVYFN
ncbi:TIGR03943 family putative permease subunit [Mediterraneibacter agrestimuris]|uniref:TIGR03943 family putative permease subunit n=1 Tax=Mediterraneibacter agrestimuris TaxID=2941333 RepID=UPI00203B92D1|nr:GTP-binding protein [Mediterraneibacter agrestimuris]